MKWNEMNEMNEWMNEWMTEWMDEWMDERTNEWMNGWMKWNEIKLDEMKSIDM